MFGFLFRKKRLEVRRLLDGRMNRNYARQIRYGKRVDPRGNFCEVAWVIPFDESTGKPDFSRVMPLVTKDSSSEGLSLIHTEPITGDRFLVGLPSETGLDFVYGVVEHHTPLGYGYYKIGLHLEEIVRVAAADVTELHRHLERFAEEPFAAC